MTDLERTVETQLKQEGFPKWVMELQVLPDRKFRTDFAWPDRMICLECEGGTWTNGRHTRGSGYEGDCIKYSLMAIAGWCVIRATVTMIERGDHLDLLEAAFRAKGLDFGRRSSRVREGRGGRG